MNRTQNVGVVLAAMLFALTATDCLADNEAPPAVARQSDVQNQPQKPQLHPSDEAYLLEMRRQIRSQSEPAQKDRQPNLRLDDPQAFRDGLRRAASERHTNPASLFNAPAAQPTPGAPFRNSWPSHDSGSAAWGNPTNRRPQFHPTSHPDHGRPGTGRPGTGRQGPDRWRVLLGAAGRLEQIAHELDGLELWSEGDLVRQASQKLRNRARQASNQAPADHKATPPADRE